MQTNHVTSEIALAATCITLGISKFMELLVQAQSILASISYIVAIVAGAISIYYRIKNRNKN